MKGYLKKGKRGFVGKADWGPQDNCEINEKKEGESAEDQWRETEWVGSFSREKAAIRIPPKKKESPHHHPASFIRVGRKRRGKGRPIAATKYEKGGASSTGAEDTRFESLVQMREHFSPLVELRRKKEVSFQKEMV